MDNTLRIEIPEEVKPTPGPWTVRSTSTIAGEGAQLMQPVGALFSIPPNFKVPGQVSAHDQMWANIRLILAVPELLEALQWIVTDMEFAAPETFVERCHRWRKRASAAITKATRREDNDPATTE